MLIDIERESGFEPTFKTESLKSKFDLQIDKVKERFTIDVALPDSWNVGVIYGASGTGKSTILKHLFGQYLYDVTYNDQPIIEAVAPHRTVDEITDVFNKVGFSSPPSWLKPYHVLSNGEKMRVDLAQQLLYDAPIIAFDEFTSVVDRNVAKICSFAVSKYVRKYNKQLVVASCHDDILDWLEPDWVIDTNSMSFQTGARLPEKDPQSSSKSDNATPIYGDCFANITI